MPPNSRLAKEMEQGLLSGGFKLDELLGSNESARLHYISRIFNATPSNTHFAGQLYPQYGKNEGLIFLKTHKTAGSTLSGVLWRSFCEDGAKNCFLPPREKAGKTWDLNDVTIESISSIAVWSGSKFKKKSDSKVGRFASFDGWLQHVKFNKKLFSIVHGTKRLVTIVRHPSRRFESAWYWYTLSKYCPQKGCSIAEFAAYITPPHLDPATSLGPRDSALFLPTTDQMTVVNTYSFDLRYRTGFDSQSEELAGARKGQVSFYEAYEDLIRRARAGQVRCCYTNAYLLNYISEVFKLTFLFKALRTGTIALILSYFLIFCPLNYFQVILLVADRFDESLVALSRLLDLKPHQLLYLPQKQRILDKSDMKGVNITHCLPQNRANQDVLDKRLLKVLEFYQPYDSFLVRLADQLLDRLIYESSASNAAAFSKDLGKLLQYIFSFLLPA